jgi:PAS domain S-box-containing protein
LGVVAGDNPLKWLSVNSRLIKTTNDEVFVFATFIDVTKLILSNQSLHAEQEKLKESEEKFSQSFHASATGMAIVSPDGGLRDVNEAFCKMLGYTREQLRQKTFQDITYPDDLEKDLTLVKKMLERTIKTYQLEKRYVHKNGQIVWALLSVSLVLNAAEEPQFFVSQIQEITEQKKLNKWLEDRNIELLKTQTALKRKIGQLKDFAGIITHDVRGPAGNIKRMLEIYETSPTRNKGTQHSLT